MSAARALFNQWDAMQSSEERNAWYVSMAFTH